MFHRLERMVRMMTDAQYREDQRLRALPPKQDGQTSLFGPTFRFVDGRSAALQHLVIMQREMYAFSCGTDKPRILDVGANIGVSVLYFKQQYPGARITAIEADRNIAEVLRHNVASAGLNDVEVVHAAVTVEGDSVTFVNEGIEGGHISYGGVGNGGGMTVPAVRLQSYLEEPVDLLKLDIEGAEIDVMPACKHLMGNVKRLFVEFHSPAKEPQRLAEFMNLLAECGFRMYVQTDYCPKHPLRERPTDRRNDLQLNIFGLREST
ncbi:MAG: FkbM family methyltransferase [Planctomycetes bacterium]|nr:FkbM family methyltransferase [Planctomycetota bacterium]